MIIYVDVKSGKVDLTKEQLDKLLDEKYKEGLELGKKLGTIIYRECPYNYLTCPHTNKYYPSIVWTGTNTGDITTGTISNANFPTETTTASTSTITYKER